MGGIKKFHETKSYHFLAYHVEQNHGFRSFRKIIDWGRSVLNVDFPIIISTTTDKSLEQVLVH
jgi:hypothetical protein